MKANQAGGTASRVEYCSDQTRQLRDSGQHRFRNCEGKHCRRLKGCRSNRPSSSSRAAFCGCRRRARGQRNRCSPREAYDFRRHPNAAARAADSFHLSFRVWVWLLAKSNLHRLAKVMNCLDLAFFDAGASFNVIEKFSRRRGKFCHDHIVALRNELLV